MSEQLHLTIPMTMEQIRDGIHDLAPFRHSVDLPYGLNTVRNAPREGEPDRVSALHHRWETLLNVCGGSLDGLTVLDVACNCGGWSVEAARSGAKRVLGFDVVDRYIEQANFIKAALVEEIPQVEFRKLRVEDLAPDLVGTFDVTLCFGILYHLQDPVRAMQAIASVTNQTLLVATMVHRPSSRWLKREKDESLWRMKIRTAHKEEVSTANLWVEEPRCEFEPTPRAVIDLLRFLGFSKVTNILNGGKPSGLFLAQR